MARITFRNDGTSESVTEWSILRDGLAIGEMTRSFPSRWHANGVGGLVVDREAQCRWSVYTEDDVRVTPADGLGAVAVKRLVKAAIQKQEGRSDIKCPE